MMEVGRTRTPHSPSQSGSSLRLADFETGFTKVEVEAGTGRPDQLTFHKVDYGADDRSGEEGKGAAALIYGLTFPEPSACSWYGL